MGVAHCENEHFTYDITPKVKTKFLGNSLEIYPVGRLIVRIVFLSWRSVWLKNILLE